MFCYTLYSTLKRDIRNLCLNPHATINKPMVKILFCIMKAVVFIKGCLRQMSKTNKLGQTRTYRT